MRQILAEVVAVKQRVTTGIRTGQTERRGTSRKSLRAPGERAERRIFRNDYKLSVLAEYDRCSEPGEKGALLRREGLYSSIITDWRRQHREGILVVTEGRVRRRPRGPIGQRGRPAPPRERTLEDQTRQSRSDHRGPGKSTRFLEQLSKSADNDDS